MSEIQFEPKANDELVCLILHAQHLINAQTLYRQDTSEQFEQIFQPNDGQVICPISDNAVAEAEFVAYLNGYLNAEHRNQLGDVAYVAIGTILQLWDLRR